MSVGAGGQRTIKVGGKSFHTGVGGVSGFELQLHAGAPHGHEIAGDAGGGHAYFRGNVSQIVKR